MNPSRPFVTFASPSIGEAVLKQRSLRRYLRFAATFLLALLVHAGGLLSGDAASPAADNPSDSPKPGIQVLPVAVDLRPVFEKLRLDRWQQGSRPTCSAFTVAGALEFAVAKRQDHGTRLSVEFLNWASNRACHDRQDGGFFSDLWKGYAKYGICTAQELPYAKKFDPAEATPPAALVDAKTRLDLGLRFNWIKEWNVKTGLTDTQLLAIKRTLHQGWPVCGGFRWPKQQQWVDDVLQMCGPDAVRDGHSVLLVGYRDEAAQLGGGVFIFRNTANGGRDGFMPYGYAREYMNDAAWIDFPIHPQPPAGAGLPAPHPFRQTASAAD